MKLYERDLPGEYNLKTNFSKDAYKAFLDKLKTDYPELVTIFKNDDYYGYGTWFYEKAFDYYTENEGEINWNNLDKFVQDFLETEGNSFIHILDNVKQKEDKTRAAIKTGEVDGKKVWHWDYEDDPDDGTRRQFKADGVNPIVGTYDGVYESTKLSIKEAKRILKESGYQLIDEAISEGRYCIMNKNDNTYFTGMGATDKCFPWTDDIEKAYRRFGNESYAKYSAMETIDYIVWHDGKRLGIDTSDLVVVDTKTGETFEYTEEKPKGFFRFD